MEAGSRKRQECLGLKATPGSLAFHLHALETADIGMQGKPVYLCIGKDGWRPLGGVVEGGIISY